MKKEFDTIVQKCISPVLAHYTGWVLSEAARGGKGRHKASFLSGKGRLPDVSHCKGDIL